MIIKGASRRLGSKNVKDSNRKVIVENAKDKNNNKNNRSSAKA